MQPNRPDFELSVNLLEDEILLKSFNVDPSHRYLRLLASGGAVHKSSSNASAWSIYARYRNGQRAHLTSTVWMYPESDSSESQRIFGGFLIAAHAPPLKTENLGFVSEVLISLHSGFGKNRAFGMSRMGGRSGMNPACGFSSAAYGERITDASLVDVYVSGTDVREFDARIEVII